MVTAARTWVRVCLIFALNRFQL